MKKKKSNSSKANKYKAVTRSNNAKDILEGRPITCIAIIDTRMVLEHHALTSILSLTSAWLLNTDATTYIYNNHGFFSTFTPFIKKIVGAVTISYGKGSISMG